MTIKVYTDGNNPASLTQNHRDILQQRGISEAFGLSHGLSSVDLANEKRLRSAHAGYKPPYPHLPLHETTGILIEYPLTPADGIPRMRVRSDITEFVRHHHEGQDLPTDPVVRIHRYICQSKLPVCPYIPWEVQEIAADTAKTIYITEAPLKALSLTEHGMPAIGLGGVLAGGHDTDALAEYGELAAHPMLRQHIRWTGRDVVIVFDAGIANNPAVAMGAAFLVIALEKEGARVRVARVPYFHAATENDCITRGTLWTETDQGPDDYIARNGADALRTLVDEAVSGDPVARLQYLVCQLGKGPALTDAIAQMLRDLAVLAVLDKDPIRVDRFTALAKAHGIGARAVRHALSEYGLALRRRAEGDTPSGLENIIKSYRFHRSSTGRVFTVFDGEAVHVDSERYVEHIAHQLYKSGDEVVTKDRIRAVTTAVVGPRNRLPLGDAPIRYAYDPEDLSIWIDLAEEEGRTVHVTANGAEICNKGTCSVPWYRPDGTVPMPVPVIPRDDAECEAAWDAFWEISQRETQEERVAAYAWIMSAARPMRNPKTGVLTRYTVGNMTGEHGGGKTTAMEMLGSLVSPRAPASEKLPPLSKIDDMIIRAEQAAYLAYDNASHITPDHSDELCRVATGQGSTKRSLYSDRDLSVFLLSRPIVLNGITDIVTRDDLLSRCVLIPQSRPRVLRGDTSVAMTFAEILPRILGAIVYCMSVAMRNMDGTVVDPSIRMAEAAQWAAAAEQAAGFPADAVSQCYLATRDHATGLASEDPLISSMIRIIPCAPAALTEKAEDILDRVTANWRDAHPGQQMPKTWPKSAKGFYSILAEKKGALTALGVTVTANREARPRTLTLTREMTAGEQAQQQGPRLVVDNTRSDNDVDALHCLENT